MQGGDTVCNYIYLRIGNSVVNVNKIQKISGVTKINMSVVGWTMMVEADGRDPEEIVKEIQEKGINLLNYRILRGRT